MKAIIGYCAVACVAIFLVSHAMKSPTSQVSQVKTTIQKRNAALAAI